MRYGNICITLVGTLAVMALVGCTPGGKGESMNKEELRQKMEAIFTRGEVDLADGLLSPDIVSHSTGRDPIKGLETIKESVRIFRTAFPDLQFTITDIIMEGDTIAFSHTYTGTHRGPFRDIPATGRRITWTGMCFAKIRDGKVVESFETSDDLGMQRQLGLIAPPK